MEKDILKFNEFINESVENDETFAHGLNRVVFDNKDEDTYEKVLNVYFTKFDRGIRIETEKHTVNFSFKSISKRKHTKSIKYRD